MEDFFDEKIKQGVGNTKRGMVLPKTKEDSIQNAQLFFEKLEEMGFNIVELRPIIENFGNQLIESCAGAGKTTLINLKLRYDEVTGANLKVVNYDTEQGIVQHIVPKRILVSTFLNTGAKELKDSYNEWGRKLGIQGATGENIVFKTIHSEVKGALEDMGVPTPIVTKTDTIVKKIMVELNVRNVNAKGYNPTVDEVRDVQSIIGFARNMLDEKRYEHQLMGDYKLTSLTLDLVLKRYMEEIKATYGYDYEYLQETLLGGIQQNPNVANFVSQRYDMVIVDEFQDTSQLQYEILKTYFKGKQVIVVGDSDQTIYSFRGSDIRIILEKFPVEFNPSVFNLTYNYRCKSVILNALRPSIERNKYRYPKELRSSEEGGDILVIKDKDPERLVKLIDEDMENQRTVGVVARLNFDLLMPSILLELDEKYSYALSKGVSLNNRLPKQIIGMMELVTKRYSDGFKGHLESLLQRKVQREADHLAKTLSVNSSMNLYEMELKDIEQSYPNLYPVLYNMRLMREQRGNVATYLYLLYYMKTEIFDNEKSTYAKNAREFIIFMENIIENHPKLKDMSLEGIHHLFANTLPNLMQTRQGYQGKSIIKLTTIHEAKGKEWDTVIMWNVIEGVYPNEQPNHIMTEYEFEEERRVFYIGGTRGRDKLVIFTEEGRESPFINECDFSVLGLEPRINEEEKKIFDIDASKELTTEKTLNDYINHYIDYCSNSLDAGDTDNLNLSLVLQLKTVSQLEDIVEENIGTKKLNDKDLFSLIKETVSAIADNIYGYDKV